MLIWWVLPASHQLVYYIWHFVRSNQARNTKPEKGWSITMNLTKMLCSLVPSSLQLWSLFCPLSLYIHLNVHLISLRTTAHLITPSHHLSYLFSDIHPPISSNNTTNLYPSLLVISDTLQLLCSPSCPPSFLILPSSGDFSFSMTVLFSTWIMITVWLRYSPSGPRWQV